jgi:aminomethyltransferase
MTGNKVKKSTFFDFLNRYTDYDFESFVAKAKEDVDYYNWRGYCLTNAYDNASSEYAAVRNSCALFDASPVKKYKISGADAGAFIDFVMTRPLSQKKPMRVYYATFCDRVGLLLDDGLLYKFTEDNYLLMVSEIEHDQHFSEAANQFENLIIEEVSSSLSGLALQGPKSCAVLDHMGITSIENLKPFEIRIFDFDHGKITIARVGFTGDLGYELWFDPKLNETVKQAIVKAETTLNIKIAGYGLTALNALRLEGGFIVPGWDTAQTFEDNQYERTPAELGLSWTVDLNRKDNFIGKAALLKENPRFKTIGLTINQECELEDGIELYATIDDTVLQVGTMPSVAWSYNLNCWIGLASIITSFYKDDLEYILKTEGKQMTCYEAKIPFVKLDRYLQTPAPI